jgi:hypothetical protein
VFVAKVYNANREKVIGPSGDPINKSFGKSKLNITFALLSEV